MATTPEDLQRPLNGNHANAYTRVIVEFLTIEAGKSPALQTLVPRLPQEGLRKRSNPGGTTPSSRPMPIHMTIINDMLHL